MILAEAKLGGGGEVVGSEVSGEEFGPGGGSDHGGVVCGEGEGGKGDGDCSAVRLGCEAAAELGVCGDSARDEDGASAERLCGGEGLLEEVADDGVLKAGEEVEGLRLEGFGSDEMGDVSGRGAQRMSDGAAGLDRRLHVMRLRVAKDRTFDAREREVEARVGREFWTARLDGREGEGDGSGVSVRSESIDPGATGVAEAEELGDLVEGFAGGVVDGAADVAVLPERLVVCGGLVGEVEVGVSSGDDEGEEGSGGSAGGEGSGVLHENGVDVAFEVVDGEQGFGEAEG